MMNEAREAAQLSNDPNTKVGCVISGIKGGVSGYNYLIKDGMTRDPDGHGFTKYDYAIHAEIQALCNYLVSFGLPTGDEVVYVTHLPCTNCIKHLAFYGLKHLCICLDGKTHSLEESRSLWLLQDLGFTVSWIAGKEPRGP
jgi:deoxycytidylate deaminase